MKLDRDGFILSTGKAFYANRCILGLDKGVLTDGYDGVVWEAQSFTSKEKEEIAKYMIGLWVDWGDIDLVELI